MSGRVRVVFWTMARGGLRDAFPDPGDMPPSPDAEDENKLEYIKAMIAQANEDKTAVKMYVAFALGLTAFLFSEIGLDTIFELPVWVRSLVFAAITLVSIAAVLFFAYIRALHITGMRIRHCLLTLDAARARALWSGQDGVWKRSGIYYRFGEVCITLGVVCFFVVLGYIVFGYTPSPEGAA